MKTRILLSLMILSVLFCVNADTEEQVTKESIANTSDGITISNLLVKDGSGTELGYLTSFSGFNFHIINSSGYLYSLLESGTLAYYTQFAYISGDCSGTPYVLLPTYSKVVYTSGATLYKSKNSTVDNITYNSVKMTFDGATCNASPATAADAYELETTTRAAVGIPAIITGPIQIVYPE